MFVRARLGTRRAEQRREMRLLAVATVLAQGCGTSIALSYPLNVPFLRAHDDVIIAKRPVSDQQQTTVARIETGPLRVTCQTTTTTPVVEATLLDSFGGLGRVWCGFMAVSEGALAAGIATNTSGNGGLIAGAIIGADALGALVYAIVASSSASTHTEVGAALPETSSACGDQLAIHVAGESWAVKRDGSIDGDVKALASAAVAGEPISIASGGLEVPWSADARDRCALVGQFGLDDQSGACTRPTEVVAAPALQAHEPLQIRITLPVSRRTR
jgi:hypothetical protein